jgi:preprotein translocase subunit SecG
MEQEMPQQAKWALALAIGVGLIALGWRYTPVLVTLHILVCFVLILVIMLQSGSAADLAGAFGGAGSQTAFGPRGAASFLSRATTWCAIVFMMSSLALSMKRGPGMEAGGPSSVLEQTQKNAPAKAAPPVKVTPMPVPTQAPAKAPAQTPPPASAPTPKK